MARETGIEEMLTRWAEEIANHFSSDPAAATPEAVYARALEREELMSFDVIHSVIRRSRKTELTRLRGVDLDVTMGDGEDGYRRIFAAVLAVRALELLQPSEL